VVNTVFHCRIWPVVRCRYWVKAVRMNRRVLHLMDVLYYTLPEWVIAALWPRCLQMGELSSAWVSRAVIYVNHHGGHCWISSA